MLKLDHVVLHADGTGEIEEFKRLLDAADVPFEPSRGKKARGFRISNIWLGRQYFEIVDIQNEDNSWQPQWAERHASGDRGAYCIFFKVDRRITEMHQELTANGIRANEPERTSFRWLFGLLEKKMPWQFMLLPKIPGTGIELGFIAYDAGVENKMTPYMVPNGTDVGLSGMSGPTAYSNDPQRAQLWIEQVQSAIGDSIELMVDRRNTDLSLRIAVNTDPGRVFDSVRFSDIELAQAEL